ncbi:MAG: TetR/AcrR family transcriptional regulator [Cytophagales bacterium]|nr:TetR/AcrR family transcriptional regulator [Cytophagales bacterium]
MKKSELTEQKILEAAKREFFEKGFKGARMQAIADRAEINKGLLHYYFKSKERLFTRVFDESAGKLFRGVVTDGIDKKLPFLETVELFIDRYMDLIKANVDLPKFVLTEINEDPKRFIERAGVRNRKAMIASVQEHYDLAVRQGTIRDVGLVHLLLSVVSLSVFPFLVKPMVQEILTIDEKSFIQLVEERREYVKQMIGSLLTGD